MADWTPVEKTATGPDGAKMAYTGGQWVPAERTATGPNGAKMAMLVGGKPTPATADPLEEPGLIGAQEALGLPPDSPKTTSVLSTVKDWFSPSKAEKLSGKEVLGDVAAQTVGGATLGLAGPKALQAGGKLLQKVPYAPVKAVGAAATALGTVLGDIPPEERMLQGAGGGAAQATAESGMKALGAPPVVSIPVSLGAGGLGEAGASFLAKETSKLATFAAKAMGGDANGAVNAVRSMIHPYEELNAKTAAKLQERMFGKKLEDRIDNLKSSENRMAVQEQLRKEDPTLVTGFARKPEEPEVTVGAKTPLSDRTDLAPSNLPLGPKNQLVPAKPGAPSDKSWIQRSLDARREAAAKDAAAKAEQALKPASTIYRERLFSGITQAIQNGKPFSTSQAGQDFAKKLYVLVQSRELTPPQAEKLLATLRADRNPAKAVQERYAQNLDDQIRMWGKPAEKGGQEGAAAIPARIAGEVREDLRAAVNKYTESVGLGKVEQQYRSAYSREMLAEAKDILPHYLTFKDTTEFEKVARNLARDPEGKLFIQKVLGQHLASTDSSKIAKEFTKLQDVLVKAELLEPAEMKELRLKAESIQRVADKGLQLELGKRLQRMILTNMSRKLLGTGGAAAGRVSQPQQQ